MLSFPVNLLHCVEMLGKSTLFERIKSFEQNNFGILDASQLQNRMKRAEPKYWSDGNGAKTGENYIDLLPSNELPVTSVYVMKVSFN